MSDKGEALASELAALSVEEASAPPDSNGEKPSAEPAEGADPGGKITGVVSWFNVAKGFGARARGLSRVAITVFLTRAFARRAVRARAREARSRCLAASLSSPDRSTRALAWLRIRPRASRFPARHVPDTLVRRSYYARLMPLPIAGFVTRDDGEGDVFVHQSDIYSQGFRSLRNQEPVEFGLEPIGDGRFKAVNVRPTRLRPGHTPDVSKSTERFSFFFFVFFVSLTRDPRSRRRTSPPRTGDGPRRRVRAGRASPEREQGPLAVHGQPRGGHPRF